MMEGVRGFKPPNPTITLDLPIGYIQQTVNIELLIKGLMLPYLSWTAVTEYRV